VDWRVSEAELGFVSGLDEGVRDEGVRALAYEGARAKVKMLKIVWWV